jgi:hypothetical protein
VDLCGWIRLQVGFLLHLLKHRWSESRRRRRVAISLNKADGLLAIWIFSGELLLPAGQGGEGAEFLIDLGSSSREGRVDVYARVCSCRQCWASKCRGL